MRWLWQILINLIALGVVLAMFKAPHSQFETIVISGLTLIYASFTGLFASLAMIIVGSNQTHTARFVKIAQLLKDPEIEEYQELLKKESDDIRKTQIRFSIHFVFTWIMSLVAIWKLVRAVLWE